MCTAIEISSFGLSQYASISGSVKTSSSSTIRVAYAPTLTLRAFLIESKLPRIELDKDVRINNFKTNNGVEGISV